MSSEQLIEKNWYSAMYPSGYSIIFQVIEKGKNNLSLCRKDGVIVDAIPEGYTGITFHGITEPEYE